MVKESYLDECLKCVEETLAKFNPYPHIDSEEMKHYSLDRVSDIIRENTPEIKWDRDVRVAGRIMAVRIHGGLTFADLYDEGYRIQLFVSRDTLGDEKYRWFIDNVRRGDILWVKGRLMRTKRGELSIRVKDYKMLVKCMIPLQHTWIGIEDPELRLRKRYLDMVLNLEVFERIKTRYNLVKEIRLWMYSQGFYETDTPILQPVYGGAAANPFKTFVNALDEEWYLRIAPELYLKRLLVAGFNKVFEIAKVFRNEDIDVTHHPEFTMMEAYVAYADYNDMMELAEKLISHLAEKMTGGYSIRYPIDLERAGTTIINQLSEDVVKEYLEYTLSTYSKRKQKVSVSKNMLKEFLNNPTKFLIKKIGEPRFIVEVNLKPPYLRVKLFDLLKKHLNIDPETVSDEEIIKLLEERKIVIKGGYDRDIALVKLFEHYIEKKLIQPTFVIDYPKKSSPLAKPHRKDPRLVERFELFIAGIEVANGYTEQNNALEQYL
ncbi:MAG: hypothetical protein DRO40_04405, partial [Thermoprotei archaeon]